MRSKKTRVILQWFRDSLAAAALLLLASCSGGFTVYALVVGDELMLTVEPQGMFGFESCVEELSILDPDGNHVWDVARPASDACENDFPVRAAALAEFEAGVRYRIDGHSPGVFYGGQFEIGADGSVVNYSGRDGPVDVPAAVHR